MLVYLSGTEGWWMVLVMRRYTSERKEGQGLTGGRVVVLPKDGKGVGSVRRRG